MLVFPHHTEMRDTIRISQRFATLQDVSLTGGDGVSLSSLARAAENTPIPTLFGHKTSTTATEPTSHRHHTKSQLAGADPDLGPEIGHTIDLTAALRLTTPAARIEQARQQV